MLRNRMVQLTVLGFVLIVAGILADQLQAASFPSETILEINGQPLDLAEDAAPYLNEDQRLMVPLRLFAEAIGVPKDEENIGWNPVLRIAEIHHDGTSLLITVGSSVMKLHYNLDVQMDSQAVIQNGRVFVPARSIAEALGAKVYWDGESQRVVILTKEYIENHKALETGELKDMDHPWLAQSFVKKFSSSVVLQHYGSAERIQERIKAVRQLADGIEVRSDDVGLTIVIPEYEPDEFQVRLNSPDFGMTDKPGSHSILYENLQGSEIGFSLTVFDEWYQSYPLYQLTGVVQDGKVRLVEGSLLP